MHVISKKALAAFWRLHPDAEQLLRDWFRLMEQNDFTDFASLRAIFASADLVGKVTVFNIGGNKYRLIVKINYPYRVVYIRFVGTHAEYDQVDAETV